jgi:hypothetical protein
MNEKTIIVTEDDVEVVEPPTAAPIAPLVPATPQETLGLRVILFLRTAIVFVVYASAATFEAFLGALRHSRVLATRARARLGAEWTRASARVRKP